jgi:ankyrin repeat protein
MSPSRTGDDAELKTLVNARGAISQESNVNAQGSFSGGPPTVPIDATAQEPSAFVRAAQIGDLETIKDLFKQGEASAQDIDDDGTTALHWAAINNRMSVCQYLIEQGALVDVKGGDLQATPLHWACRNGLVYIAHLLINHGADPLRTDNQGFNALHLATHSSNVLLVIYLLHHGLPVDATDPNERTACHWAAYQGDTLTIDTLLKWGTNVKLKDTLGFTPLHWAVVKGSKPSIKRLIEEGSDVFAVATEGKSARVMAEEMQTVSALEGALLETGRLRSGAPRKKFLSPKSVDAVIFFSPCAILPICWYFVATWPWFISFPATVVLYFAYLKVLNDFVFPNAYFGHGSLLRSPFLAGVFFASCVVTLILYLLIILPATLWYAPFLNVFFASVFALALFAFFSTMLMDPGFVPKLSGINEQKAVIEQLLDRGEYDARHFCISTYIRKPLRSKFDRKSGRVVARFDHYCPWVNNVIGVRNHRMFVIYVVCLFVGIPLLLWLYIGSYTSTLPEGAVCSIAPTCLCGALEFAPFTTVVMFWNFLQLVWIVLLLFVQLVQIARAMTTSEATNFHRFGFMGGDDFSSLPQDHHSNLAALSHMAAMRASPERKCWSSTFRVLGIDQFVSIAQDSFASGRTRRSWKEANPASFGLLQNCKDFWLPVNSYNIFYVPRNGDASFGGRMVDYYTLWDFPKRTEGGYDQV